MAHTLEAALIVPLTLVWVAGLTGIWLPQLMLTRDLAERVAQHQAGQLSLHEWYQTFDQDRGLRTSPQISLEMFQLWQEYQDA